MAVLVDAQGVTVRRSDRPLFQGLSVTVGDGERVGVVGINGTGKSTLLRILAGDEEPDEGVVRRGRGCRIAVLHQNPRLPPGPVSEAVGEGWEAEATLERLGMGGQSAIDVGRLSGGQAKRVALARVLSEPSEVLVLDEPTNHLDIAAVSWLTRRLVERTGGLVLVTHDRHLLDAVSTRILELDRGRAYVHDVGYASYLAARIERQERADDADTVRRNLARRELAWLRRGAPARSRKPAARVQQARRVIDRRPEAAARRGELDLGFATPRLGDLVITAERVSYRYEADAGPVISEVDLALDSQSRLGLVGANGSGKSTLLDLLAGRKEPTSGRVRTGPRVAVGYYDQEGRELDPNATVGEVVAGPTRVPGDPGDKALMERFWFGGALSRAPVATLSGGERRRLQLLVVLATRPNVLLLDEPTNDLDLDTLRILEDYLDDWPGALVTVSHDRAFLERATDQIVSLDGVGHLHEVAGGLAGWLRAIEAAAGSRRVAATVGGGCVVAPLPTPPGARRAANVPGRRRSATTVGFQLRELERSIAGLERQTAALEVDLAAAPDHTTMARVGSQLAARRAEIHEAEDRWLALAQEAESDNPGPPRS